MAICVRSHVFDSMGRPVAIEDFDGEFSRDAYIHGLVELEVDGVKLLDRDMTDTIDALWSFFVAALEDLERNDEALLSYPERPYTVRIRSMSGGRILIRVGGVDVPRSAVVARAEFLSELRRGAIEFFRGVLRTSPKEEWSYRRDLTRAVQLAAC
ncbi:hypothetical protein [Streptomyces sp. NPDC056672]|uniref:hypothetical protein n=1 Tax=Streptomyces sp. NPDC056672 TaxID=3345906 RepID=UPI00368261B9